MSSNDIAVSVRGLSKSYSIAHNAEKHTTLGEMLMHRLRRPLERPERETFWALKDVSFDIKKGDVVGIIGRNGAGKSTLLKILSRITEPTTGAIDLYGRVGSLLEVGTGFHPELTGRENIYLNGAILGMKRSEITRQFDAIVDFAEVEKFLDTPVKRYSSGMYVRLAFAVAAHLNPEILIVDEVLAVGDAEFQRKCLGKMKNVSREQGRTILFVSHNLAVIRNLCDKAIYLRSGRVEQTGNTNPIVDIYLADSTEIPKPLNSINKNGICITECGMRTLSGRETDTISFASSSNLVIGFHAARRTPPLILYLVVKDGSGEKLTEIWGPEEGLDFESKIGSWGYQLYVDSMRLFPGQYSIDVLLHDMAGQPLYETNAAILFDVTEYVIGDAVRPYQSRHGKFRVFSNVTNIPSYSNLLNTQ